VRGLSGEWFGCVGVRRREWVGLAAQQQSKFPLLLGVRVGTASKKERGGAATGAPLHTEVPGWCQGRQGCQAFPGLARSLPCSARSAGRDSSILIRLATGVLLGNFAPAATWNGQRRIIGIKSTGLECAEPVAQLPFVSPPVLVKRQPVFCPPDKFHVNITFQGSIPRHNGGPGDQTWGKGLVAVLARLWPREVGIGQLHSTSKRMPD
jgi:hypothetical protein